MTTSPTVAIIGGGLAGLSAASLLCERGFQIELFEAKRQLGGRAGSFIDPTTGELVDHCQHVAMGCCTEFLDFCKRTGVDHLFRKDKVLHFFSPEGKRYNFAGTRWLPAPLHLGPAFMRLGYLTRREKLAIARAMGSLYVGQVTRGARKENESSGKSGDLPHDGTIGSWLRAHRQSQRVIDRFWSVVLVSALGESVDRASIAAARKVFVDGFLSHRNAYHLYVPQAPLGMIYDEGIARWLTDRGVGIHREQRASRIHIAGDRVTGITIDDTRLTFDHYLVATPWHVLLRLFDGDVLHDLIRNVQQINGSPITSIHLWFDRPITQLPHAVLVDRFSQWVFNHVEQVTRLARQDDESLDRSGDPPHGSHYQVVISASHDLARRTKQSIVAEVLSDLRTCFPDAALANLMQHRIITQPNSVFSYTPDVDQFRAAQQTPVENLYLAGDWTATGWPATMESAVRSGRLAAESIASAKINISD